jgi:thioredoxin-like negative regulator of GroEL
MSQEQPLREWGEADFDREVLASGSRAVVMFGDPRWSSPCHMTRRALLRLVPQMPGLLFGVVNMADSPRLCQRFRAYAMPTVIVFEKGVEVRRVVGWRREEEWPGLLAAEDPPTPANG